MTQEPSIEQGVFTDEQKALVGQMLDDGYTPERLASYLARLNDIDEVGQMFIEQLATNMAAERGPAKPKRGKKSAPPPASDAE